MAGKYWRANDDGADYRCGSCGKLIPHHAMYFCETPNGRRWSLCEDCIDPSWQENASYEGVWKEKR